MKSKLTSVFLILVLLLSIFPATLAKNDFSLLSFWNNGSTSEKVIKGESAKFNVFVAMTEPVAVSTLMYKSGSNQVLTTWINYNNWEKQINEEFTIDTTNPKYAAGDYNIVTKVTDVAGKSESITLKLTVEPKPVEPVPCQDTDKDGVCNDEDNCAATPNPNQLNIDGDGWGNACDTDDDNDGIIDEFDACPQEAGSKENSGCPGDVINQAPKIVSVKNNYLVQEMGTLSFCISIQDEQTNTLILKTDKKMLGYELNQMGKNKYAFSWTPDYTVVVHPNTIKDFTLTFTADDGALKTEKEVIVTVKDVNQLPVITVFEKKPVQENEEFNLLVGIDDKDKEDQITFTKMSAPAWANLKVYAGNYYLFTQDYYTLVSGSPGCDQAGKEHLFELTATDGIMPVSKIIHINVVEACEVPVPCPDHDNDNICDAVDICPKGLNTDADNDGICDYEDSCVDMDQDTICDNHDQCLAHKEDFDEFQDTDGCPETQTINQAPGLIVEGDSIINENEKASLILTVNDESLLGTIKLEAKVKSCFLFICTYHEVPAGAELKSIGKKEAKFSWTPSYKFVKHPAKDKEITFTFTANDGEFSTSQDFILTVRDINQLPQLNVVTNEPFETEKEASIVLTASDADTEDELDYTILNKLPKWLDESVDGKQLTLSGTPGCSQADNYKITVKVSDGIDETGKLIPVNVAYKCFVPPPCDDEDQDGICDEVDTCPNGVNTDLDNDGTCDYEDSCVDQDKDLVCDAEDACLLVPEDIDGEADSDGCPEDAGCADADKDSICDDVDVCPTGSNEDLDQDGICDYNDHCIDQDVDSVCDDEDQCLLVAADLDGNADADGCPEDEQGQNTAPSFTASIPDQTGVEGDQLVFNINVLDLEGDKVILSYDKLPSAEAKVVELIPNSVYQFSWTTKVGDAGNYKIGFRVCDDQKACSKTEGVGITILPFVPEPGLDTDGDGIPDAEDQCPSEAEDLDGNEDVDGCPEEEPCADGDIDGICDEVDACPLAAEDLDGVEDTDGCFDEDLPPVNHAPKILSMPITMTLEKSLYSYQFSAVDPDGDELVYALEGPVGMTLDEKGLVQWTPGKKGKAQVAIAVSDGKFVVTQKFTISVGELYKNVQLTSVQLVSDSLSMGDYLSMQINTGNNGNKKMKDLKVTAMVYDWNSKKSSGEFDLNPGQGKNINLNLPVPYYVEAGDYLVKVTVSNNQFHDSVYRLVSVS